MLLGFACDDTQGCRNGKGGFTLPAQYFYFFDSTLRRMDSYGGWIEDTFRVWISEMDIEDERRLRTGGREQFSASGSKATGSGWISKTSVEWRK